MNTCPKCGSPQESPKLDGTTARIWFTCGSYGYADKPDQVFRSSDKCLDREEINDLQIQNTKLRDIAGKAMEILMSRPPQEMACDIVILQAELKQLKENGK